MTEEGYILIVSLAVTKMYLKFLYARRYTYNKDIYYS